MSRSPVVTANNDTWLSLPAVQAALLPRLMPLPLVPPPYSTMDDYLISAPTGSGKTLAYALPIVHILSTRVVTRLRALIVLPTKDLVVQVRETLEALAKGTGLQVNQILPSLPQPTDNLTTDRQYHRFTQFFA